MATGTRCVTPSLVRQLGQLDATMILVGILIGSGIFIVSAESSRLVGAPGWLLAAWALAGIMTITGSQCCAELAAMMPHAGGQYVFAGEIHSISTPVKLANAMASAAIFPKLQPNDKPRIFTHTFLNTSSPRT